MSCAVAAFGRSRARVAWRLLGGAILAYGGTAIYYTLVPKAADLFPSVYDFGLFGFYPLVFAALVAFLRKQVDEFSRALWIDSALGALVLAAIGTAAV